LREKIQCFLLLLTRYDYGGNVIDRYDELTSAIGIYSVEVLVFSSLGLLRGYVEKLLRDNLRLLLLKQH